MVTDDKVIETYSVDDNVNTRDQRRVGIWFLVITLLFVGFLMSLGLGHAPQPKPEENNQQTTSRQSGNMMPSNEAAGFSVRQPVGYVELPGTVGKQQNYLVAGHGNTPVPNQGVSIGVSPGNAINSDSFAAPKSGSTASDAMQTGKNYQGGANGNKTAAGGQNNRGGAVGSNNQSNTGSSGNSSQK
jgi:hypothetical protein